MALHHEIRENEVAVACPDRTDAALVFVGIIRTPWSTRAECPHYGVPDGPVCRIEVGEPWVAALDGIEAFERIEVLYGCIRPAGIWSAKVQAETARRKPRLRSVRRSGRTRSGHRSSTWSVAMDRRSG